MLSGTKLKQLCEQRGITAEQLAPQVIRAGQRPEQMASAVKNWQKGLFNPIPKRADVERLAAALGVDVNELSAWKSTCRFAPISPRKARLVTRLIVGRGVQDALDVLKFTHKRAASMIAKVLESAIANADEAQADVENLYVSQARANSAGVRIGTKRWIAKDRGRTHPIRKSASHICITVTEQ